MSARTRSGFRLDDADAIYPIYQRTLMQIANTAPSDERRCARRIRMLADALQAMAMHMDNVDPEASAIDAIDREFAELLAYRREERS